MCVYFSWVKIILFHFFFLSIRICVYLNKWTENEFAYINRSQFVITTSHNNEIACQQHVKVKTFQKLLLLFRLLITPKVITILTLRICIIIQMILREFLELLFDCPFSTHNIIQNLRWNQIPQTMHTFHVFLYFGEIMLKVALICVVVFFVIRFVVSTQWIVTLYEQIYSGGVEQFLFFAKRNQLALSSLKNFLDFSQFFPIRMKFQRKSISHINVIIHNFDSVRQVVLFLFVVAAFTLFSAFIQTLWHHFTFAKYI